MTRCRNCGGAIGEPDKAYGYAGRWCVCQHPNPSPLSNPFVVGAPSIGTPPHGPLKDLAAQLRPPEPAQPKLTPAEFIIWLRGYLAAFGGSANNMDRPAMAVIIEKLDTVGGAK